MTQTRLKLGMPKYGVEELHPLMRSKLPRDSLPVDSNRPVSTVILPSEGSPVEIAGLRKIRGSLCTLTPVEAQRFEKVLLRYGVTFVVQRLEIGWRAFSRARKGLSITRKVKEKIQATLREKLDEPLKEVVVEVPPPTDEDKAYQSAIALVEAEMKARDCVLAPFGPLPMGRVFRNAWIDFCR